MCRAVAERAAVAIATALTVFAPALVFTVALTATVAVPGSLAAQLTCASSDIGHRLRHCSGGTGEVTVVLEAGARSTANAWNAVAADIAAFARVASYDRAGRGHPADRQSARSVRCAPRRAAVTR